MKYIHNESILMMKKILREDIEIKYRLFESSGDYCTSYSALISVRGEGGSEEDYFIPDFANNRMGAMVLFNKLYQNTVLPCEVEEIYSDGFAEIL